MKRRVFGLGVASGLFILMMGCAPADEDAGTSEGAFTEGATGAPLVIELVQADFFEEGGWPAPRRVPRLVHVGFADARGEAWQAVHDVEVVYQDGKNKAVDIVVPAEQRSRGFLFYSIAYDFYPANSMVPEGSRGWISDLAVRIDAPAGRFVTLPIWSSASSPFAPECFEVSTANGNERGKLRGALYGFTTATRADYDANKNVPWLDVDGLPRHEGFLPAAYTHDGGYKGRIVALPMWTRVPAGRNLVFKASTDRFTGQCIDGDDTRQVPPPPGQDSFLSETNFLAVP